MRYSKENYAKIKQNYQDKALQAEKDAETRKRIACISHPDLGAVEKELSHTGMKIMRAALEGKEGLEERLNVLRDENTALLKKRAELLRVYGYRDDYFMPWYDCDICNDEGHVDGKMCICMKKALAKATFESSGLSALAKKQSFDNFSLEYYNTVKEEYDGMVHILGYVKGYAKGFSDSGNGNLLFCGGTGLGKTHLSTAAASVIIQKGYDVVYDTAVNIFAAFEHDRFERSYNSEEPSRSAKFFDCDLLIIDDLGVELTNQFTISCLYNLINTRLASDKSMIINTNLTHKELITRYDNRIVSRLLGEFVPFVFKGKDIRMKKLANV